MEGCVIIGKNSTQLMGAAQAFKMPEKPCKLLSK